ncbi:hypothetical protein [Lentzea albidocapillata]|uniref:hypothetical protein n=1 Tax=Lentzea albidocapillata TaxID=40571 RepID=UPI00115FC07C|nr:hypothetical protein [Lentzea albidocapillata]
MTAEQAKQMIDEIADQARNGTHTFSSYPVPGEWLVDTSAGPLPFDEVLERFLRDDDAADPVSFAGNATEQIKQLRDSMANDTVVIIKKASEKYTEIVAEYVEEKKKDPKKGNGNARSRVDQEAAKAKKESSKAIDDGAAKAKALIDEHEDDDNVIEMIVTAFKTVVGIIKKAWEQILAVLTEVWNKLRKALLEAVKWIRDQWNKIIDGMKRLVGYIAA